MDKVLAQKLKTLTILYAEDEEGIRKNIADSLRYYAKDVIEASDGKEAYKLYKKHSPDIIYTDIMMPYMDGVELVAKIRKTDSKTPIVMVTAHTDKEYLLRAVELHLEQYIIKPISLKELKKSLEKCIHVINLQHSIQADLPDNYKYDFDKKILTHHENEVKLTKKEVIFFELLLQNRHRVVSYVEIENHVWGDDIMTDLALKSLIRNIRAKFPKKYITNLSGVGYKLNFNI